MECSLKNVKNKKDDNSNKDKNDDNTNDNTNSANNANEIEKKTNSKILRPLTLQSLLTLISGPSTPCDLVIIATTNYPDKLDKALIRAGRLTLLEFGYLRYEDIVNMLNEEYDKESIISKLNKIDKIDNIDRKISGATLNYIISCTNNLDDAIKMINDIMQEN